MSESIKKAALLTGLFLFLFHFLLISVYLIRPVNLSVAYVYPYFHQSWSLFVPPPETNYYLYTKIEGNADKTTGYTVNVFEEMNGLHRSGRLKGHEMFVIGLSNCIHYFEKENEGLKIKQGKVTGNNNFEIMRKFVSNYLKSNKIITNENFRIILLVWPLNEDPEIYYN